MKRFCVVSVCLLVAGIVILTGCAHKKEVSYDPNAPTVVSSDGAAPADGTVTVKVPKKREPRIRALLVEGDANKDGSLTLDEWKVIRPKAKAKNFVDLDTNKDNVLNAVDYGGSK